MNADCKYFRLFIIINSVVTRKIHEKTFYIFFFTFGHDKNILYIQAKIKKALTKVTNTIDIMISSDGLCDEWQAEGEGR